MEIRTVISEANRARRQTESFLLLLLSCFTLKYDVSCTAQHTFHKHLNSTFPDQGTGMQALQNTTVLLPASTTEVGVCVTSESTDSVWSAFEHQWKHRSV